MKTELCELAEKYRTDKCPMFRHNYTPFYYELFKDKRESVKKFFEMGIGYQRTMWHVKDYIIGASHFMWRDFFPNAHIYGADNRSELIFNDERITTYLCDETSKEQIEFLIKTIGGDIDIFIDDGSHRPEHQIFLCKTVMPFLKKDVIYIIEDVKYPDMIIRSLPYDLEIPALLYPEPNDTKDDRLIIVKNK